MNSEGRNSAKNGSAPVYPEQELTHKILEAAFTVHNALGCGFLEKIYENALCLELQGQGIACEQQAPYQVKYRGVVLGDYFADVVVEKRVLVEVKAGSGFDPAHEAQVINYLRASRLRVALLLNFGRPKLQYRRLVFG